jgi:hypothetical protein
MRKLILLSVLVACGGSDDPNVDAGDGSGDAAHDAAALTCDPALQTGCALGTACYSDLYLSPTGDPAYYCATPGAGVQGTSCAVDTDCAKGFWCLKYNDPNNGTEIRQCSEYCRGTTPGMNHGCSGPKLCVEGSDTPFGYCI